LVQIDHPLIEGMGVVDQVFRCGASQKNRPLRVWTGVWKDNFSWVLLMKRL